MLKATEMIPIDNLQARRTVSEQLDSLVLETYGAVDLLFPETGTSSAVVVATSAWCHTFTRQTPSTILFDLAECGNGQLCVRDQSGLRMLPFSVDRASALLDDVTAEIVIIESASVAAEQHLADLLNLFVVCAARCQLTIAPIANAASVIHQQCLRRMRLASDALIAPDVIGDQRAALIAASLVRNSRQSSDDEGTQR